MFVKKAIKNQRIKKKEGNGKKTTDLTFNGWNATELQPEIKYSSGGKWMNDTCKNSPINIFMFKNLCKPRNVKERRNVLRRYKLSSNNPTNTCIIECFECLKMYRKPEV